MNGKLFLLMVVVLVLMLLKVCDQELKRDVGRLMTVEVEGDGGRENCDLASTAYLLTVSLRLGPTEGSPVKRGPARLHREASGLFPKSVLWATGILGPILGIVGSGRVDTS